MTVAHALTSGLGGSSAPSRAVEGRGASQGSAAFRDALDKASRDTDKSGGASAGKASGAAATDASEARRDTGTDKPADGARDPASGPAVQADASGLSAMLAALAGGEARSSEQAAAGVDAQAVGAAGAQAGASTEAGLWMPGQVRESLDVRDGEQLLTLLAADPAAAAADDMTGLAGDAALEIKAKVVAQETHLAREAARSDVLARLVEAEQSAVLSKAAGADGALETASLNMAETAGSLPQRGAQGAAAPDAGARGGAVPEPEARAATVVSPVATGVDSSGVGGDRLQGGAGASGSLPQGQAQSASAPSETGVFAALLQGAGAQGARPVEDDAEAALHVPISDQIAEEVRAELRADGVGETSSEGMVKVLQLELKPANLGAVTVRIALKDNVISVHIEAQRRETVVAIEREREALLGALSSAGYTVEAVSAAPQSDGPRSGGLPAGFSEPGAGAFQAPAGQGFANSSGGQGRPGEAAAGDSAYHSAGDSNDVSGSGVRSDANGLYV